MAQRPTPSPRLDITSGHVVIDRSLGLTWQRSLRRLLDAPDTALATSNTAGDFLDWESVTLLCPTPQSPPVVSRLYPFPELVEDYAEQLVSDGGEYADFATIAQRIYRWPCPPKPPLNQVDNAERRLNDDPGTRRALIQIWDPTYDADDEQESAPISHCQFYFSIRDGRLNMTIMSRSVDAWLGAVPNMIAFAELQRTVADRLKTPVGMYRQFILSYHLYCAAIPIVRNSLDSLSDAEMR